MKSQPGKPLQRNDACVSRVYHLPACPVDRLKTSSLEMTFNVNVNQVSNDNYQSLISEGTKRKEKKVKMGTLVVSNKKKTKEGNKKEGNYNCTEKNPIVWIRTLHCIVLILNFRSDV